MKRRVRKVSTSIEEVSCLVILSSTLANCHNDGSFKVANFKFIPLHAKLYITWRIENVVKKFPFELFLRFLLFLISKFTHTHTRTLTLTHTHTHTPFQIVSIV